MFKDKFWDVKCSGECKMKRKFQNQPFYLHSCQKYICIFCLIQQLQDYYQRVNKFFATQLNNQKRQQDRIYIENKKKSFLIQLPCCKDKASLYQIQVFCKENCALCGQQNKAQFKNYLIQQFYVHRKCFIDLLSNQQGQKNKDERMKLLNIQNCCRINCQKCGKAKINILQGQQYQRNDRICSKCNQLAKLYREQQNIYVSKGKCCSCQQELIESKQVQINKQKRIIEFHLVKYKCQVYCYFCLYNEIYRKQRLQYEKMKKYSLQQQIKLKTIKLFMSKILLKGCMVCGTNIIGDRRIYHLRSKFNDDIQKKYLCCTCHYFLNTDIKKFKSLFGFKEFYLENNYNLKEGYEQKRIQEFQRYGIIFIKFDQMQLSEMKNELKQLSQREINNNASQHQHQQIQQQSLQQQQQQQNQRFEDIENHEISVNNKNNTNNNSNNNNNSNINNNNNYYINNKTFNLNINLQKDNTKIQRQRQIQIDKNLLKQLKPLLISTRQQFILFQQMVYRQLMKQQQLQQKQYKQYLQQYQFQSQFEQQFQYSLQLQPQNYSNNNNIQNKPNQQNQQNQQQYQPKQQQTSELQLIQPKAKANTINTLSNCNSNSNNYNYNQPTLEQCILCNNKQYILNYSILCQECFIKYLLGQLEEGSSASRIKQGVVNNKIKQQQITTRLKHLCHEQDQYYYNQ